jgi:hypothetical protein
MNVITPRNKITIAQASFSTHNLNITIRPINISLIMQNHTSTDAAKTSPLYIFELLEAILLYLSPREIIIASSVCEYWHTCVARSPTLLRKIHKILSPFSTDTNPHFDQPSLACRNALIPRDSSEYYGKNVLDFYESADIEFLTAMHFGIFSKEMETVQDIYLEKRRGYRAAFMNVRYPDGWPERYRTHCDLCDGFHARFRFENVHPLLSFLDDVTMCVRGHAAHLYVVINIANEIATTDACYEHYHAEIRYLAGKLRWALKMMEEGGHQDEMFARPVCTKLVAASANGYYIVDNTEGITIGEVIPLLVRSFKVHVSNHQELMHWWLPKYQQGTSRDRRTSRDRHAAFPTKKDFEEFERNFGNMVERFDELMREVNESMKGVAAWDDTMLWVEQRDLGLINDEDTT